MKFKFPEKINPFYRFWISLLLVLLLVRVVFPSVLKHREKTEEEIVAEMTHMPPEVIVEQQIADPEEPLVSVAEPVKENVQDDGREQDSTRGLLASVSETMAVASGSKESQASRSESQSSDKEEVQAVPRHPHSLVVPNHRWHRLIGVHSYEESFPDVQDVQIKAARKWGVKPPKNREEAELRKDELVYIAASPFYRIDPGMSSSIPYLVPRAALLLQRIGRSFCDSCYVKGLPVHKIIVSSVLRTEDDVVELSKDNINVSSQSCHRFGTTFDICWTRFCPVENPNGPRRECLSDAVLKTVLCEVLRDLREEGACYVKHEIKQSCFHITCR